MRRFDVSKGYLTFMYLMDTALLHAMSWTWYQYKEPFIWLMALTIIFSVLVVIFQIIYISSLYLFMIKDKSLWQRNDSLDRNYQFIKGLY